MASNTPKHVPEPSCSEGEVPGAGRAEGCRWDCAEQGTAGSGQDPRILRNSPKTFPKIKALKNAVGSDITTHGCDEDYTNRTGTVGITLLNEVTHGHRQDIVGLSAHVFTRALCSSVHQRLHGLHCLRNLRNTRRPASLLHCAGTAGHQRATSREGGHQHGAKAAVWLSGHQPPSCQEGQGNTDSG